ncbi:hypothetical protein [Streptosporangium sp. NPDC000239]|uniref:hypothetical protein n=1 Tax=unclassified Streptosporangium TaxID=2632669 RepID=UPI00331884AD
MRAITSARRTARPLAVLSGAALALFLTAQGAGATTSPDDPTNVTPSGDSKSVTPPENFANATPPEAQAAFAEQGRAAGLTEEQITTLQNSANLYLSTLGGRQVALNKVVVDGKADVFIALPEEDAPRDLSPEAGLVSASGCAGGKAAYGHFCAWREPGFRGTTIDMYSCGRYPISLVGNGSWDNNQTKGTRARMYNKSGKLIYTTPPAHSRDSSGDWTPVHSVRNC